MATTSRPPVPIAIGSGDAETEEGRAFFQGRLALFGQWIFVVSGAFLAIFGTIRLLFFPFSPALLLHAVATLLAGILWSLRWRTPLSLPAMRIVDVVGTVLICATFGLMTLAYARQMMASGFDPTQVIYVGLLTTGYVLMARAVAVPGTAARAIWVGAIVMGFLQLIDAAILSTATLLPSVQTMAFVEGALWKGTAIAMSAVASRVIFGLRQEVSQVRKLGQYTLEEKIGEGGMGIVYRARHAMLRRPTAIKLLPPDKAGDENVVRFEREVQLTAGLSHPNTVAIFDYGRTADGIFYYAMEYLDGINLDQLVTLAGSQPARRVVHILKQVCGALAEAHDIGLVHRDVKPANIILCERGGMADVAKVVDFGLVKRFRSDDTATTTAATVQATLVGTPLYMAPESFSGPEQVDARSDLYALGAVAYVLLTGTPVFSARSLVEVGAHHLHTRPEPPSARLGRRLPAELENLVLRCLAKSPADRPPSARALRHDLDHYSATDPWSEAEAANWWTGYRRSRAVEGCGEAPGRPRS
jgi:eukaryotic-like serine/threonine-protein kinase